MIALYPFVVALLIAKNRPRVNPNVADLPPCRPGGTKPSLADQENYKILLFAVKVQIHG